MGVLAWIGYTAAAIALIALVVGTGLFIGAVLAVLALAALCVFVILMVASTIKSYFDHRLQRRRRRSLQKT